ncbi:MAG: hypothetical protein M3376_01730 [Actinomycetota bacterium]|nr:hypothetical protein [Actinomycetota bacterium]
MSARDLLGSLPGWTRSRYGLLVALLLVVVPVAVSLSRDAHFYTTLEVFPTSPPGNAGASSDDLPAVRAVVANPGFQFGTQGWRAPPGSALSRSTDESYSGSGSLASVRDARTAGDWRVRVASTQAVLPSAGRYSVQARVRLPRDYSGGRPTIVLEGFSGSRRVVERTGDPALRERWQLISADYVVEREDTRGLIVLRTGSELPAPGQVLHWDDVRVLSNDVSLPAPDEVNLVANPGFEHDRSGWGGAAQFDVVRSERLAHTGRASLRSSTDERAPADTNAGHTYIVFPRPGTYRVKAWVYVVPKTRDGRPAVFLEGFLGSTQLAQTLGDPGRRGTWQWVATDYVISPQDLEGSLVLRDLPGSTARSGAAPKVGPERVLYWDDVSVTVPRRDPPHATLAAARVRSALDEPQLRAEIGRVQAVDDLYDPRRASVQRSSREGTLSFVVKVRNAVPADADRLAQPLRSTLLDAARRGTRREAQRRWRQLITTVGESLPPGRRALLQRRAQVMEHVIGAQPVDVVAPPPAPAPSPVPRAVVQAREQQAHEKRQRIISRIGADLPPWQRALVQQQADNLQRMIAADTAEFVVLPSTVSADPSRRVDRLLADLPGPYPIRVGPISAGVAGLICGLLLLGMLITMTAARQRADVGRR